MRTQGSQRTAHRVRGLLLLVPAILLIAGIGAVGASTGGDTLIAGTSQLPSAALAAPARLGPPASAAQPGNPKLDSALAALAASAGDSAGAALAQAQDGGIAVSGDRVQVQITVRPEVVGSVTAAVAAAGGEVTGVGDESRLIQAWVPVTALEALAASDDVSYLKRPAPLVELEEGPVLNATSEGLAAINAPAWHAAGYRGAGVKVAIVDGGFTGYPALLGSELPVSVVAKNFVDGESDAAVNGTTPHGTACAEIVHDIAPLATLYLVKVNTTLDLEEAKNYLVAQGVDIISTSIGWYNSAPGDGTGYLANIVSAARSAGVFWATAAGNDREAHWGGPFVDGDLDGAHEFAGAQEINFFGPGGDLAYQLNPGFSFIVFLRWSDWSAPVDADYNLYLVASATGSSWVTIAQSTSVQNGGAGQTPTEVAVATTSAAYKYYGYIVVRAGGSTSVNFDVFIPKFVRTDELLNARSLANLADAPAAMTVAALDVNAPYPQESYSSEGPTNGAGGIATGGVVKPDIAGFANVSTNSYGTVNKFNGTSSATPHVAGAAAVVLSANPSYTPAQLQSFLQSRAIDMGAAGKDSQFGYGRLWLGAAPSPTAKVLVRLPSVLKTGLAAGFWEAPNGHEFYVTPDRAYVDDYAVYVNVSGCGSYIITHIKPEPIAGNKFSFSGVFYASGTFASDKTASGTDGLNDFPISGCGLVSGGPWGWNATWQNGNQPSARTAYVTGPDVAEATPAGNKGYVVTRVR